MSFQDKGPAWSGSARCTFHADDVAASQDFRKQYEAMTNEAMTNEVSVSLRPALAEDRFRIHRWLADPEVAAAWGSPASALIAGLPDLKPPSISSPTTNGCASTSARSSRAARVASPDRRCSTQTEVSARIIRPPAAAAAGH